MSASWLGDFERIPRRAVAIPKPQQLILERPEAWTAGGLLQVPPKVLSDQKSFHARRRKSRRPPMAASKPQPDQHPDIPMEQHRLLKRQDAWWTSDHNVPPDDLERVKAFHARKRATPEPEVAGLRLSAKQRHSNTKHLATEAIYQPGAESASGGEESDAPVSDWSRSFSQDPRSPPPPPRAAEADDVLPEQAASQPKQSNPRSSPQQPRSQPGWSLAHVDVGRTWQLSPLPGSSAVSEQLPIEIPRAMTDVLPAVTEAPTGKSAHGRGNQMPPTQVIPCTYAGDRRLSPPPGSSTPPKGTIKKLDFCRKPGLVLGQNWAPPESPTSSASISTLTQPQVTSLTLVRSCWKALSKQTSLASIAMESAAEAVPFHTALVTRAMEASAAGTAIIGKAPRRRNDSPATCQEPDSAGEPVLADEQGFPSEEAQCPETKAFLAQDVQDEMEAFLEGPAPAKAQPQLTEEAPASDRGASTAEAELAGLPLGHQKKPLSSESAASAEPVSAHMLEAKPEEASARAASPQMAQLSEARQACLGQVVELQKFAPGIERDQYILDTYSRAIQEVQGRSTISEIKEFLQSLSTGSATTLGKPIQRIMDADATWITHVAATTLDKLFETFKATYPHFKGSVTDFVRSVQYLARLQKQSKWPGFLSDDRLDVSAQEYFRQHLLVCTELPFYSNRVVSQASLERTLRAIEDGARGADGNRERGHVGSRQKETAPKAIVDAGSADDAPPTRTFARIVGELVSDPIELFVDSPPRGKGKAPVARSSAGPSGQDAWRDQTCCPAYILRPAPREPLPRKRRQDDAEVASAKRPKTTAAALSTPTAGETKQPSSAGSPTVPASATSETGPGAAQPERGCHGEGSHSRPRAVHGSLWTSRPAVGTNPCSPELTKTPASTAGTPANAKLTLAISRKLFRTHLVQLKLHKLPPLT